MKQHFFSRSNTTLSLLLIAFLFSACTSSSGKVLAKVNGSSITEADLNFLGDINPHIKAQILDPNGKRRIVDNLVEQNLLYQEAIRRGVNRERDVKAKIDLYRRVIISQSLIDKEIEKMAKKYYDENQEEFKKLELAHIMVSFMSDDELKKAKKDKKKDASPMRSEKEALELANQVKSRLDKGEDFATLAKQYSEDTTTKDRAGSLGRAAKNEKRLVARGFDPLLEKAFEMKVGEIAGPIKTTKGYHLIIVTNGVELDPFETVKDGIAFKVRSDAHDQLLAALKKDAKITYAEEEGAKTDKAAPAQPATPPASPAQPVPQASSNTPHP